MPFRRHREGGDLCAIYVHAGAGYHSTTNERFHLAACEDAAKVAMALLKNGAEATDAVEMAIKLLEDREITNAGYGSNLTMEGHVECDATMVDHYGRSGAVGAVSRKCNPSPSNSWMFRDQSRSTFGMAWTRFMVIALTLCRGQESYWSCATRP